MTAQPLAGPGSRPQTAPLSSGIKLLIAFLAAKFVWDVILIVMNWPDFSRPKLGIATVLPVLIWGLSRSKNWALNLTGVACFFWIAFLVARLVGPVFAVGEVDVPFPWSNLLALPAIVFVMNNLKTDEELRANREP